MAGINAPYGTRVCAIANDQRVLHGVMVSRHHQWVRVSFDGVVRTFHARYVYRDWP